MSEDGCVLLEVKQKQWKPSQVEGSHCYHPPSFNLAANKGCHSQRRWRDFSFSSKDFDLTDTQTALRSQVYRPCWASLAGLLVHVHFVPMRIPCPPPISLRLSLYPILLPPPPLPPPSPPLPPLFGVLKHLSTDMFWALEDPGARDPDRGRK